MKSVQSTLFVSILTLLLGVSVPAQAAPSLQPDTLSDRDLELLFEQDGKPMQLALLSDQEMAETEGAWFYAYGAFYGGSFGGSYYLWKSFFEHPGTFGWDGFSAYIITGSLIGGGGVGYTIGGKIVLGGMLAAVVQDHYAPKN